MKIKLAIFFAIIVVIEIVFGLLANNWTFINGALTITNRILLNFSFLALLFTMSLLLKASKILMIFLGILFAILFCLATVTDIYPIDTTTEPVDIATLHTDSDRKELIVREYKNVKNSSTIRDTVSVKDIFIFRKLYK